MYPNIQQDTSGVLQVPSSGIIVSREQISAHPTPSSKSLLGYRLRSGSPCCIPFTCIKTSAGNANAYYPTVGMRPSPTPGQQHTSSSYSNGPSQSSTSHDDANAAQQNFPMLRVQVAEQYRTMPPVSTSMSCLHVPEEQAPCTHSMLRIQSHQGRCELMLHLHP